MWVPKTKILKELVLLTFLNIYYLKELKIKRWFKIVTGNGGVNNANTTDDRTYYYEVFPSNNLELGLWMEAERMPPCINQIGVDTQNEVVKEEKRLRVDNQPYGNFLAEVKKRIF
jgi:predicted Zn-dependent peptidase